MFRRRHRRESDLERELQAHLDLEAADQGDSAAARRALGNIALIQEATRETWGWTRLGRFAADLRFAARLLRRNPAFTAVAALSLALGIGANTAIFTLMDALLWKLLPVQDPASLLFLGKPLDAGIDPSYYYETYDRLRREQPFLGELAAYSPVRLNVDTGGEPESCMGQLVSGNYFSVLGVPAIAGRVFSADDDRTPGAHPVAVISEQYWERRFGRSPDAIGRHVRIDGTPFTIVGVTPAAFFGTDVGAAIDLSVPVMMQPQVMPDKENWLTRPRNTVDWLRVFGRLKPGVTVEQATAGMATLHRHIQADLAAQIGSSRDTWLKDWVEAKLVLVPGGAGLSGPGATGSSLRREFTTPLYVLMGVVGLVLLIACANVANLLLARATARRREIAVRLAIGATRGRLIRQLLVESLTLSALGAALGFAFASWGSTALVRFLSAGRSLIHLDLAPDLGVLAFTAAVAAATGVVFGLAPAIRAAGLDLAPALKEGSRGAGSRQSLGKALAVVQVAFSVVLLVGAGLLVRTLRSLDSLDGSFARDRVYTVALAPRGSDQKNGPNGERLNRLYLALLDRVHAIPGVASATLAGLPPMMQLPPRTIRTQDGTQQRASWTQVYPEYFAALGVPLLHGRDFAALDLLPGAPFVTIVNETFARRAFPGQNPLGKRVLCSGTHECEVIGVVRDVPYSTFKRSPEPTLYTTFLQGPTGRGQMHLVVRFAGNPAAIAAQLRHEIAAMDPQLPAFVLRTLAEQVDAALIRERVLALLSTVFGALAIVLAGIGLYGVIAYSVGRRSHEIGVRMALGARPSEVRHLIVRESMALAGAGVAIGIPAALAATRLITSFLHGVNSADPVVLGGSAAFLLLVGVAAAWIPAARAAQINPVNSLRAE
jgi:predicted permease